MNQPDRDSNAAPRGHRPEPVADAYRNRKTLLPAEAALLELVRNLSVRWGVCKAGVDWLAQELGVSTRYVQVLTRRLHEKGCLSITPRRGKSNLLKVLRDTPEDAPVRLRVRKKDGVNSRSPHPRTPVHPRGRTAVHPTKNNTSTLPEAPLYAAGGPGWFNAWEVYQAARGERPADAVQRIFEQGSEMFCRYLGHKPEWEDFRGEHHVVGAEAGNHVLFLTLAVEGTDHTRQVRVGAGALAAWRFR